MCGIAGFLNLKNNIETGRSLAIGQAMGGALAHRGPDAADCWKAEDISLVLSHRRLSIIDLSEGGRQPMTSPSGRYVVSYNGEIYNYPELKAALEKDGHGFKSRSDTEVMLAAIDQWGLYNALQKMNGMFALALWDKKERQLHFARDRFGKKPLYIGWAADILIFASELKALKAYPDFKPAVNRDALALYMQYGCVQAPYSIYQNVWQLLPASYLTIDPEKISAGENLIPKMKSYWSLKEAAHKGLQHPNSQSEAEIIEAFDDKLTHAVSERMISDVPLGAFLSGGIDSSLVVSVMQKIASVPSKTFSIGFEEAGYNEADHAKDIAAHLETDHQEFYVTGKEALDVIPLLPTIYDEPFADSSQIPTYLISKLARQQVTVALTGDGGDEILGGYDRHAQIPALWKKFQWLPYPLRAMLTRALAALPPSIYQNLRPDDPLFAQKVKRALHLMGHKNAEEIYKTLVSFWQDSEAVVIDGTQPVIPLTDDDFWPEGLDFQDQMIFGDTLSYRVNDLMVKTDRASMAVALEARAPLMDYKLAEYCWTLPSRYKIRNGQGKWLLRQVLARYVPPKLFERPKMGFSVPLNQWLRGALKPWADDLLSTESLKAQGYLNPDLVTARWQQFQQSDDRQTAPKDLWAVLMFQAWLKQEK